MRFPFRVADLKRLPDDGYTYEIVEEELLRMPASEPQDERECP